MNDLISSQPKIEVCIRRLCFNFFILSFLVSPTQVSQDLDQVSNHNQEKEGLGKRPISQFAWLPPLYALPGIGYGFKWAWPEPKLKEPNDVSECNWRPDRWVTDFVPVCCVVTQKQCRIGLVNFDRNLVSLSHSKIEIEEPVREEKKLNIHHSYFHLFLVVDRKREIKWRNGWIEILFHV